MTRHFGLVMVAAAGLLGAAGCQDAHFFGRSTKVAPVAAGLSPVGPYAVEDRLYAHAVAALEQRDYVMALDVLQMARELRPDDPRVLSAMGVVYDKLGRFDLSSRYYALAEQADPGSKVVAIDRAYSQVLQRTGVQAGDGVVVMARLDADARSVSLAGPGPVTVQQVALIKRVLKAGVRVRNATGRPEGADRLRVHLAAIGWTLGGSARVEPQRVFASSVAYPTGVLRVAKALARSLPYPVRLAECSKCSQLQLLVGQDALIGPPPARATTVRRG